MFFGAWPFVDRRGRVSEMWSKAMLSRADSVEELTMNGCDDFRIVPVAKNLQCPEDTGDNHLRALR